MGRRRFTGSQLRKQIWDEGFTLVISAFVTVCFATHEAFPNTLAVAQPLADLLADGRSVS